MLISLGSRGVQHHRPAGLGKEDKAMLNYIWALRARRNDEGATAVEYGLLVAAIAAVIVAVVFVLGHYVHGAFSSTCSSISTNGVPNATAGEACP
jgi:pilus assembly protein Flp/PilA